MAGVPRLFVLDHDGDLREVPEPDWFEWMAINVHERAIAKEATLDVTVATSFLGIEGKIYETMVIVHDRQSRLSLIDGHALYAETRAEAQMAHEAMCEWLRRINAW